MAIRGRWDPSRYPKPKRWTRGYVSKAQARKFERTPSLRKYVPAMWANTPGGSTFRNPLSRRAKLSRLPERVKSKRRRRRRR